MTIEDGKVDMTIKLAGLTVAQAIAMKDMFEQMRILGGMGGSRFVGYYADGDGNFRPKPEYEFSDYEDVIEQFAKPLDVDPLESGRKTWGEWTDDMYLVDFDVVAWRLHHFEEQHEAK